MKICDYLSGIYRGVNWWVLCTWNKLFAQRWNKWNAKSTPIIINNFNRLSSLKMQIEAFERMGYTNIYIIDNASTYPPLLEFYKNCQYPIFRLKQNIGYLAFWEVGIYKRFKNKYFVYTDSDIIPNKACPDNFLDFFHSLLDKYSASKVGFALDISDIPLTNPIRDNVQKWEQKYWENELEKDVYLAEIDTTFALYRPNCNRKRRTDRFGKNIRVGGMFTAKHLPWYNDVNNLSEEEQYYISSCRTSTHWSSIAQSKICNVG